ncbi:unnamed protein product, partial [Nesidiocoris tenuis]
MSFLTQYDYPVKHKTDVIHSVGTSTTVIDIGSFYGDIFWHIYLRVLLVVEYPYVLLYLYYEQTLVVGEEDLNCAAGNVNRNSQG